MPRNNYCDIGHCTEEHGEVRLLPHTSDPLGGNDILCQRCHAEVLTDRRERNRRLSPEAQYPLPAFEDLKPYTVACAECGEFLPEAEAESTCRGSMCPGCANEHMTECRTCWSEQRAGGYDA